MKLTIERQGLRCTGMAITLVTALSLVGCSVGDEGTFSPDSLTCQAAQTLFGDSGEHPDDEVIERLAAGVPTGLRSTVERLSSFPASADEWQGYDADLARMQQWAVTACGATVAFPVELGEASPLLADYLNSVSREGDAVSVVVSGATGLDAATDLCEQALQEHAQPGLRVTVEVQDSFGILLALVDGDGCVINPEFTE